MSTSHRKVDYLTINISKELAKNHLEMETATVKIDGIAVVYAHGMLLEAVETEGVVQLKFPELMAMQAN